jgi:lipid II:glycine glycyltransferase (peptidoglycan interpeptide bridge formation enzyme)
MPVFEISPVEDPRWARFVESHSWSSIFHTTEWLEALRRTYQFSPRAFTTSANGDSLTNAIVFCQVDSWLTGSKLVSLPFSDHCEPLVRDSLDLRELLSAIRERTKGNLRYAELRPRNINLGNEYELTPRDRYWFHVLDLNPSLDDLYAHLHKDGMRRKIRRADREHVIVSQGRSDLLLRQFYRLLLLTRRRHRLPPQPFAWFRNLADCLGDRLTIYAACIDGRPIAAILMLRHKHTLVYKYGCSDEHYHKLGAMPRLFWQAIRDAKTEKLAELDLGRAEEGNEGLIRFKDHLGAGKSHMTYWQYPPGSPIRSGGMTHVLGSPLIRTVLSHLPDSLFRLSGMVFYRHVG